MTWTGKRITGYNAMQTTGVYACVRIIAETVASLPWHIYRYTTDGKVRDYKHPLYFLLHDEPNPEMTSFSFRENNYDTFVVVGKCVFANNSQWQR